MPFMGFTAEVPVPVISPTEAREWVSASMHGDRVKVAKQLRAEGRGRLYLVKPTRFPMSGWFRPDWLGEAQARVYTSSGAAQVAAFSASVEMASEWERRGWPTEDLSTSGVEVVRVRRLPWWVREIEMSDSVVVPLPHNTFAACGCLVWAGLLGGGALAAIAAWMRTVGAAVATAGTVLAVVIALTIGWRFLERRDAEVRAVCLSGLTEQA